MTVDAESVSTMAEGVISLLERGFSVNANVAYEAKNGRKKACGNMNGSCAFSRITIWRIRTRKGFINLSIP